MEFRITKQELSNQLGLSRATVLRRVKVILNQKDSPFTYEEYKKMGNYLTKKMYNFIYHEL